MEYPITAVAFYGLDWSVMVKAYYNQTLVANDLMVWEVRPSMMMPVFQLSIL